MNPINASAQQLAQAFDEYKKHPCLVNQSTLMDCLDNFVNDFDRLEGSMRADFFGLKA